MARGSWREKEPPQIRGTGYVVDALEAAIWAVAGARDFREAILRAANLGDDADTTAAIAGQLAGAIWGASAIPLEWRRQITEAERIAAIAGRLFDAGAGSGASKVWAHDDFVHAYWLEPGQILAGEYPGNASEPEALRRINLLVDNGVRTFVDLTTANDPLDPYEHLVRRVAKARNLDLRRVNHPIPDMGTLEVAEYDHIVGTINESAEQGVVYFHCWGGVGRTGTVAGCLLVADGMSADDALERITQLRAGTRKGSRPAPETQKQVDVIRNR